LLFGSGKPNGKTENITPLFFKDIFSVHLERIRRATPQNASFLDKYFSDEEVGLLANFASLKMNLTISDGEEHSFASSNLPVFYQVCTLPVEVDQAKNWFARLYGNYTTLVMRSIKSEAFAASGCTVFCHIVFGMGKKGGWVHMSITPVREPYPVGLNQPMMPMELLSSEELHIMTR
jgi:hypothetical protein